MGGDIRILSLITGNWYAITIGLQLSHAPANPTPNVQPKKIKDIVYSPTQKGGTDPTWNTVQLMA
ncbi:hypothetical protein K443DRAFT_676635 [Laccaria amethystina LaAM-08-1]|jgi:hypothetical protein|uniref:Uncharacterized protein n=1 Tax=Laccaria amethystina LaAM-08-1 TaxID=1095629 RepID=A0A0C9Y6G0_9AGAR|nr:hypothetical protein K443DRAFT_676635 [Laccaria amethystina LaAM-08-1]